MEAQVAQRLQFSASWIDFHQSGKKPSGSVQFLLKSKKKKRQKVLTSAKLHSKGISRQQRRVGLEVICSYQHHSDPILKSGTTCSPIDEDLILKKKSQEVEPFLNGRSIYLIGMMGCGKTTVGKILSQALGYSFRDSDAVVEQDVGRPINEIFKLHGEDFFRVKESEALKKLSLTSKLIVSTGGGAVVWPVNWRYMQRGLTVWLDVPLEALAQRIAAVGTDSRPLLHHESGDAYTRAFKVLSALMEERGEAYTKADARVSVEYLAAKTGQDDVCNVSAGSIAIEVLEQIKTFLKEENGTTSIPK